MAHVKYMVRSLLLFTFIELARHGLVLLLLLLFMHEAHIEAHMTVKEKVEKSTKPIRQHIRLTIINTSSSVHKLGKMKIVKHSCATILLFLTFQSPFIHR